jgi:hypothetical protein
VGQIASEAPIGAGENPAAAADAQQHARQEIAAMAASVARRARHLVRWLAVAAGALAGWLIVRRRRRAEAGSPTSRGISLSVLMASCLGS